jgi:hypothetical protein
MGLGELDSNLPTGAGVGRQENSFHHRTWRDFWGLKELEGPFEEVVRSEEVVD